MKWQPQISLHSLDPSLSLKQQLEVSLGTVCVSGSSYFDNTVIPKNRWCSLNENVFSNLVTHEPLDDLHQSVVVFSIPQSCLQPLRATTLHQLREGQDFLAFQQTEMYKEVMQPIYHFLEQYIIDPNDLYVNPLKIKAPNLLTVSSDYVDDQEKFVGLHADRWSHASVKNLASAKEVLCINLGLQHRFFLFINLDVQAMSHHLQCHSQHSLDELFETHELLPRFSKMFPDYPVVKLQLLPGQGYIAPVESLFHDGCTLGTSTMDISFSMRGYFGIN